MSIYKCPKGHESTESDYCSECGVKIQGVTEPASLANTIASSVLPTTDAHAVQTCPDCRAPHDPKFGNFCEICGYNFITGTHGEVPPVTITPAPAAVGNQLGNSDVGAGFTNDSSISQIASWEQASKEDSPSPITNRQSRAITLEVVATIDPSLREEGSPEAPTNIAPITFRLDRESNLIGRRSDRRLIYPEVALDFDDAVSHRHALLNRQPDGTFILRDIGSANGTKLNGVELAAMVDTPIKDGDEFTLGHWTRIKVKRRMKDEG